MTLPSFVIIGAGRSGTTSLYQYLCDHPQVFMSPVKETRYFAFEAERPADDAAPRMSLLFPVRTREAYERLFDKAADALAVGEASPRYMYSPGVPALLARTLPSAKIVAILRNPARRAHAEHMARRREGFETRSLAEVVAQERRELDKPMAPAARPLLLPGFYHRHLQTWLEHVPPSRLLVLLHDDLVADPAAVFASLCRFLGIDDAQPLRSTQRFGPAGEARLPAVDAALKHPLVQGFKNRLPVAAREAAIRLGHRIRSLNTRRPPMDPQVHDELVDLFREDVRALEGMIERDLAPWLRV